LGLTFNRERDLVLAFATPLAHIMVEEEAALSPALKRAILERAAADPGQVRSNVGGWHSKDDLLSWPEPEVLALRRNLEQAVNHMTALATRTPRFEASYRFAAWANVCRQGNYHKPHNHPDYHWSGVYYVETGGSDPERPHSGTFEVQDPRPFTEMVSLPGNPYGRTMVLKPEPGLLFLFPSWLYHWVNPFTGTGERISIAFNARLMSFRRIDAPTGRA
jgi:uncharacterized protein (TIGR02466 family)